MKYGYALIRQRYNNKNDVVEENYNKSSIKNSFDRSSKSHIKGILK